MAIFDILLIVHVVVGGLALIGGFLALAAPKGGVLHRKSGTVFLVAMLAMTTIALVLALMHRDLISIVPAMLTFYLVATGWRAVHVARTDPRIDGGLLALALAASITGYALGHHAAAMPSGSDDKGFPSTIYFVFASVALIASASDLIPLIKGPLRGLRRLARHVWRLSGAMFIATTSLFQGQEQVFPKVLQGSIWLQLPAFAVIGMAFYWLIRLALRKPPRRRVPAAAPLSHSVPAEA